MKRLPFITVLFTLALACGGGMERQDVTRLQKSLGLPASAECEGTSTWGGSMVREGLRIEITCSNLTPSWQAYIERGSRGRVMRSRGAPRP